MRLFGRKPKPEDSGAFELRFTVKQTDDEDDGFAQFSEGLWLLAAFDGCGGMGGRQYEMLEHRTSAYIASHLYAATLKAWFLSAAKLLAEAHEPQNLAPVLVPLLGDAAVDFKRTYLDREPSNIVGRMVRTLPSTMAMALVQPCEGGNLCHIVWAGNSRCYVLTQNGLWQATQDDLTTPADALDNLYADSPMSNFLNADAPFTLNSKTVTLTAPAVVWAASDGAFDALPSPMHFEALLLDTLCEAASMKDWATRIAARLKPVATDDVTLMAQAFGFNGFKALKASLQTRRQSLARDYIDPCEPLLGGAPDSLRALWQRYLADTEQPYG